MKSVLESVIRTRAISVILCVPFVAIDDFEASDECSDSPRHEVNSCFDGRNEMDGSEGFLDSLNEKVQISRI
jgi:hypothetical protein